MTEELFASQGLSPHDWESIVRRGFESKELDYKGPGVWNEREKKPCCELVKDILAMANTKGGFIVIGVSETPTGFSWDGLTVEQCKSFETSRLNRFLQNYADPPINAHLVVHESEGSNFAIIRIPRFPDTPHICQKQFPEVLKEGDFYVRTDNNESAPIKSSSDMRAIVEQAVRNRGDNLLASFRAILTGTTQLAVGPSDLEQFDSQIRDAASKCESLISEDIASLGFWHTTFHPVRFEPLRFTIPDLEAMAEAASVTYRGWPCLFYSEKRADCVSHHDGYLEMTFSRGELIQFWRLYQSGCLYMMEMFQEDQRSEYRPQKVLGTVTFAYRCVEAVQCLVDLYTPRLADDELVRLHMRLQGVQGRTLATVHGSSYHDTPYTCESDQVLYDQQRALAEWRAGVIPHAIDIVQHTNRKFNAPGPSEDEVAPLMQKLLNREL